MSSATQLLSLCLASVLFLTGCANPRPLTPIQHQMAQTPITDKPSGEVLPGKFIWHDLLTPEPEKAGQFYQALFGWDIEYHPDYSLVRNGDKLIAGIVKAESSNDEAKGGLWLPTASVADVDAAANLVTTNGGKILKGPLDMGKRGRAMLIRDAQQADLLLLSASGGDPADTDPAIGDWLWDELWSKDPAAIKPFYAAVLGYDQVLATENYSVLLHDEQWRAGIRRVRDEIDHLLWVPVVRVADALATTQRVTELGGIVKVAPGEVPGNPDIALIADTTGTLLLIQRWPSPALKEEL